MRRSAAARRSAARCCVARSGTWKPGAKSAVAATRGRRRSGSTDSILASALSAAFTGAGSDQLSTIHGAGAEGRAEAAVRSRGCGCVEPLGKDAPEGARNPPRDGLVTSESSRTSYLLGSRASSVCNTRCQAFSAHGRRASAGATDEKSDDALREAHRHLPHRRGREVAFARCLEEGTFQASSSTANTSTNRAKTTLKSSTVAIA